MPVDGKFFAISLRGVLGLKKFLRLRYVLGGTSPSYSITAMLLDGAGFTEALQIQNIPA